MLLGVIYYQSLKNLNYVTRNKTCNTGNQK